VAEALLPRRTERLVLRAFAYGDEADVLAYRGRDDVCRYIPPDPVTADDVTEFIAERVEARQLRADGERMALAVVLDDRVIGDVLVRAGRLADRQAEIGWVINPEFQRRGFATEAAAELLAMAFGDLAMHRVWAQLDPRNAASARVCERLGLRLEGHLREDMWLKGRWCDCLIYAILRPEWAAAAGLVTPGLQGAGPAS
jgi:RimJ/RimL family protein N-acetyltransferase